MYFRMDLTIPFLFNKRGKSESKLMSGLLKKWKVLRQSRPQQAVAGIDLATDLTPRGYKPSQELALEACF